MGVNDYFERIYIIPNICVIRLQVAAVVLSGLCMSVDSGGVRLPLPT